MLDVAYLAVAFAFVIVSHLFIAVLERLMRGAE